MTRRRARRTNAKKSSDIKHLSTFTKSMSFQSSNVSSDVLTQSTATIYLYKTSLHPNFGIADVSPENTFNLNNILGNVTQTTNGGLYCRGVIRKVKYTITVANQEAFRCQIAIKKMSSVAMSAIANNLLINYSSKAELVFNLEPKGVTGDIKKVTITLVPWVLDGYNSFEEFVANQNNWITYSSRSTNIQGFIVQGASLDSSTQTFTTAGNTYTCQAVFDILAIQPNDGLMN